MKLLACIKKDIGLMCGSMYKALLYILLPIGLLFLASVFMRGTSSLSVSTEAFPIAVRDCDDTVMSKLLISQLRNIPLFSEVRSFPEDSPVTDEELINNGYASVITVPKEFFYDLYDMNETDVVILLNEDMPREANIVKASVTSMASIIEQNQRVYYAAARIRYGELDESELESLYHDYSDSAVKAALERLDYFELGRLYSDEEQDQKLFFAAGVCSMLIMFIPLCILRSMYEEKELGVISRLKAAGGGVLQTVLAKLIASLVMTGVPVCAVLMVSKTPNAVSLIPALLVIFLASFAFYLFIGILFRSPERAQLAGNMIMLLMLILGGALFPYRLLPEAVQKLSPFTLPYYVTRSFYAASLGRSWLDILKAVIPAALSIPVFTALAALLYSEPGLLKRRVRA